MLVAPRVHFKAEDKVCFVKIPTEDKLYFKSLNFKIRTGAGLRFEPGLPWCRPSASAVGAKTLRCFNPGS
jgi:hypothetical protein